MAGDICSRGGALNTTGYDDRDGSAGPRQRHRSKPGALRHVRCQGHRNRCGRDASQPDGAGGDRGVGAGFGPGDRRRVRDFWRDAGQARVRRAGAGIHPARDPGRSMGFQRRDVGAGAARLRSAGRGCAGRILSGGVHVPGPDGHRRRGRRPVQSGGVP